MRVSTAFNRMLEIPGAWVESVAFAPEGVVVGLRSRCRRVRCPCGFSTRARYDCSRRRWRHLDLGACRLWRAPGRAQGTSSVRTLRHDSHRSRRTSASSSRQAPRSRWRQRRREQS